MSDDECVGCRDRTLPSGPMLLTPDLVIASRARYREPELPQATIDHALAAMMPRELAQYPVVVIAPTRDRGLEVLRGYAAEFAKRGHEVFWIVAAEAGRIPGGSLSSNIKIARIADGAENDGSLGAIVDGLIRQVGLANGIVLTEEAVAPKDAARLRTEFDWRTVSGPDAGSSASDIRIGNDLAWDEQDAWPSRWASLDRAVRNSYERVSIIVLTMDNLAYNKLCLGSIFANTEYPNYEVVIVDNGSSDGTREWLDEVARAYPGVRVIANADNVGFGPGNNQGLAVATGSIFLLLNNDTMVPKGWMSRLVLAMHRHPEVGLMGPATNRTCNQAEVPVSYQTYAELQAFAAERAKEYRGEVEPIRMLAMFCTAFRRSLYEELGPLDEQYAVGMFEDEDYAMQARQAGHEIAWAPEVFIHHAYHASIGKLIPTGDYMPLFRSNQLRFERKWGICWERHRGVASP